MDGKKRMNFVLTVLIRRKLHKNSKTVEFTTWLIIQVDVVTICFINVYKFVNFDYTDFYLRLLKVGFR